MSNILIIDHTDAISDTEPFSIHIDDIDNNQGIILPIKLSRIKPIDFPAKKRCKRRKFKSYFGKNYEAENI